MNRGFTLIELLVVVIIIGILAAVALPQYRFAVEKSRLAPKLSLIADAQKALDVYVLEKGYPSVGYVDLAAEPHDESFNINLNHSFDACNDWSCYDKFFSYSAYCGEGVCEIWLARCANTESSCGEDWPYDLGAVKSSVANNNWTYGCYPYNNVGERICASLEKQGWQTDLNMNNLYPDLDPEPEPEPEPGPTPVPPQTCSTVADCSCSYSDLGFVATSAMCIENTCYCWGAGGVVYPDPEPGPEPGNIGECSSNSDCPSCPSGSDPTCFFSDEQLSVGHCGCMEHMA